MRTVWQGRLAAAFAILSLTLLLPLAAFLVSDAAPYINGECVTIDGGEWLRGAGQFNFLEELSGEQWDALQAKMRKPTSP